MKSHEICLDDSPDCESSLIQRGDDAIVTDEQLRARLLRQVGEALTRAGFVKSGGWWVALDGDVSATVAFFHSRHMNLTYIEIGVETRRDLVGTRRAVNESAFWSRADDLRVVVNGRGSSKFSKLLDLDVAMDEAQRVRSLERSLDRVLIPGLKKIRDRGFLRSDQGKAFLRANAMVRRDADI